MLPFGGVFNFVYLVVSIYITVLLQPFTFLTADEQAPEMDYSISSHCHFITAMHHFLLKLMFRFLFTANKTIYDNLKCHSQFHCVLPLYDDAQSNACCKKTRMKVAFRYATI